MLIIWPGKLRMIDGRLCGKTRAGTYEPIRPESISYVREYGFNNPYLLVISDGRKYTIRPWAKDCEEIVKFIEEHTDFRISHSLVHRLWFRRLRWKRK